MSSPPRPQVQPIHGSPARRAFHAVLALAGWVLFVWWWVIVLGRVSALEVRFTLWFLVISLAAIVLVTALWAVHNLRLVRRKTARTHVREVTPDQSRDTVGRPLGFPAVPEECRAASLIVVRIEDGSKVYRPTIIRTARLQAGVQDVRP